MGSGELFQFIPSRFTLSQALEEGLSFSHSVAGLFILQTDTMFLKPCSDCSHAFSVAALKKGGKKKRRVFSRALSFFAPGTEGGDGGGRVLQSSCHPSLKGGYDPCGLYLLPNLSNLHKMWRMKQSFLSEPKRAELEMVALTRWTCLDYQS